MGKSMEKKLVRRRLANAWLSTIISISLVLLLVGLAALLLMNAGSVYRFYFPYQLAFGEKGTGGIPPYAPMIYEIELHDAYND